MPHVRESRDGDLNTLFLRLRPADLLELSAHDIDAESALRIGYENSKPCYTIIYKDKVIAMFGATPHPEIPSAGMVWLLGSNEIGMKDVSTRFLRESRPWVAEVGQGFDILCNMVHEENTLHIKWLRFLGFSFIRHLSPFIEFVRICPYV